MRDFAFANPANDAIQRYVQVINENGSEQCFPNVRTRLELHAAGDKVVPVALNFDEFTNAAQFSEYGALLQSADVAAHHLQNESARRAFVWLVKSILNLVSSCKLDQVARVFPSICPRQGSTLLSEAQIEELTQSLCSKYPDHSIKWSFLSEEIDGRTLGVLKSLRYVIYAARPASALLPTDRWPRNLRRPSLQQYANRIAPTHTIIDHTQLKAEDLKDLARLYEAVNRSKGREGNISTSAEYFRLVLTSRIYDLTAIRSKASGAIIAFVLYDMRHEVSEIIHIGFDPVQDDAQLHYRGLMSLAMAAAWQRQAPTRLGYGALYLKQARGAVPVLEYHACFISHLPLHRRLLIKSVALIMNHLGVRLMRTLALAR